MFLILFRKKVNQTVCVCKAWILISSSQWWVKEAFGLPMEKQDFLTPTMYKTFDWPWTWKPSNHRIYFLWKGRSRGDKWQRAYFGGVATLPIFQLWPGSPCCIQGRPSVTFSEILGSLQVENRCLVEKLTPVESEDAAIFCPLRCHPQLCASGAEKECRRLHWGINPSTR